MRIACRLPQQAARYCKKCDTRHAAKNLDLWSAIFISLFEHLLCEHFRPNIPFNYLPYMVIHYRAESRFLGHFWLYYTCVNGVIYDVTAWANCSVRSSFHLNIFRLYLRIPLSSIILFQFNHLKHIKADQHNVQYRMANVKKDGTRQSNDRYHERVMNESTEKITAVHCE